MAARAQVLRAPEQTGASPEVSSRISLITTPTQRVGTA